MNDKPLVSIIVPTYNNEETIETCLRSLINQTYPLKEIIVVNDASTDGTGRIAEQIAKEHSIVRIMSIRHSGTTGARNAGIKEAKGDIIFFGEGDAIYREHYVEKAVARFKEDKNIGGVCVLGEPWKVRGSTFVSECIDVENRIKHRLIKDGKLEPYFAWIFRREVVEQVGLFDERLKQGEDRDFFLRVKTAGYKIGLVEGINWGHKRGETTWQYMKKCYSRGKTRTLFVIKHRRFLELVKAIAPLWILIVLLGLSLLWDKVYYLAGGWILLLLIHRLLKAVYDGWSCVPNKKYLSMLPIFQVLRNLHFALGYSHGIINYLIKKGRRQQVDWANI